PDDRRAPAETRNVRLPDDVLGLAPAFGQDRIICRDSGFLPAESGPLVKRRHRSQRESRQPKGDKERAHHAEPPWNAGAFRGTASAPCRGESAAHYCIKALYCLRYNAAFFLRHERGPVLRAFFVVARKTANG